MMNSAKQFETKKVLRKGINFYIWKNMLIKLNVLNIKTLVLFARIMYLLRN